MHTNLKTELDKKVDDEIVSESIYIKVYEQTLHLKRFYTNPEGKPVFMVHGSIENGKIFYSKSGKGLAPFLAQQGYDVFVADLRGRGKSKPSIGKHSKWGIKESLKEDIPSFLKKIIEIKGPTPQHWVGHSWGGVLLLSFIARYSLPAPVASMAFFGTKRRISIFSLKKLFMINIMWFLVGRLSSKLKGYLPAKKLKMGSDNESDLSHWETHQWVTQKQWLDWYDDFDYAKALKEKELPPVLYLTGKKDDVLGHPTDVKLLMKETGHQTNKFILVAKSTGFKHDYDHINILTHPAAPKDHFKVVLDWFLKYNS